MKFTIVILTLNSASYITSCLESIACQTYTDFDLLIQDGFSSDQTINLVNCFKENHPSLKIVIYQSRDTGVYDAMNRSLEHANGEWLYFLGSDDCLFSNNTLEVVSAHLSQDVDAVYGDVFSSHFGGRYNGEFTVTEIFRKNICHQSLFLRRSVFKKHGNFNTKYKVAADWDHNLRWFLDRSINVKYIDSIIAIYGNSGLSSTTPDFIFEEDKPFNYLNYGLTSISFKYKLQVIMCVLSRALRRKSLPSLVRCFRLLPSVLRFRIPVKGFLLGIDS